MRLSSPREDTKLPYRLLHKMDTDCSIIFLHIPKTAGTTLHQIIERQYPLNRIHSFGADAHSAVRHFKNLPEDRRNEITVLKGHMGFGLHEFLPQPSFYIGMLRDPIERSISYYYHILRNPSHYLHHQVVSRQLTLKDVISGRMTPDLDNGQTRLVSGVWNDVPYGSCSSDMLKQAKRNIEQHFAVMGLVEEFDETLMLLMRTFEWKWHTLLHVRANVAPSRPRKEDLSSDTLDIIRRYNRLDLALYDFARRRFDEHKSQCKSLPAQVRRFQMLNSIFNLLVKSARRLGGK